MLQSDDSLQLTPNLTIAVHWSARVTDFTALWEQQLAKATVQDHLLEAAITVLGDVEHRQNKAEDALAEIYQVSGQLPATGDEVLVGALVMKVDQRRFTTRHIAGLPLVTVAFHLGIERYQYEAVETAAPLAR